MIKQCCVSRSMSFFQDDFRKKYDLQSYKSRYRTAIFFGCYNENDLNRILDHKSLAIVVWGGSDAKKSHFIRELKLPNIKHIAQSKWIEEDLIKEGITPYQLPVTPFLIRGLKPSVNGEYIYIYTSRLKPEMYGSKLYTRLFNVFGREKFIIAHSKTFSKDTLYEVYSSCFLGLRLLDHDGLGVTNCEMGVMGKYVITNNSLPNSLNYTSFDDIVDLIKDQQKNIGKINNELSQEVKDYLNIGTDWLKEEYYD